MSDSKALKRHDTIATTLEEAKYALGEHPPKTRLRSGREGPSAAPAKKEKAAPKPKLNKTKTMAATQKEAKEILGDEELGHTRSKKADDGAAAAEAEDKTDDEAEEQPTKKPRIHKTKTMAATAAESKEVTGNKKRGKTRAATEATPKLKKTTTMAATAKEGEEFLKAAEEKKGK